MATVSFTANPSVQEVGPSRGVVLSSGLRGDGQGMRLDGTFITSGVSRPIQVEVHTNDGLSPFQFNQQKQYTVTIAEVI